MKSFEKIASKKRILDNTLDDQRIKNSECKYALSIRNAVSWKYTRIS